ncbi:hypothetical protein BDN72DRAFT_775466 [Pluteus cervinus]|uniref:Uncharacterized protein n=1 Tax=Pluteus cervinus TaxID=181527 RepID=A0ACD3ADT4_9AGAR|nr:hypothetical protein BDN72DRAFT_775466 [Pluteus cervinus]
MEAGKQSLQDMATAIGPIVDKFDSILTAPYLNQYSATLNTVPVVGIKNNQLLYIQTTSQGLSVVDAWSTFSSLPPDVTINPGDVVHIFPYKGDFCLSVGKTVWKKVHLSDRDPGLKNAVDNWPALYSSDWTAMGDCLPSPNFAGVVPFSVLSADRDQIVFQLISLAVDGTISWMTSDQLTPQSDWSVMTYAAASDGPAASPKFIKIAYWNNAVIGIDDASNSWNINVSFQNGTFNVTDQSPIDPVTEFTATDAGPIGLRDDGYLWKRIITPSPDGADQDPVFVWERWIQADGVVNIGVASPGVILDIKLLTRTLKSRYITVQTAVYPVVEKIKAFCTTHEIFLDNVAQAAEDWQNADIDGKRPIAINNARSFITHSKTWSGIVSSSINSCQQSVTIMTSQLHDVRLQLEAQLQVLHTKLGTLQETLQSQEETMSKLQAAFWASIIATFIGLAVIVVGFATENWWIVAGGGALAATGIILLSVFGAESAQLAGEIAETKAQIHTVNDAITEMTNIVNAFSDLDNLYGTLNQFWGGISNDASNVQPMDDATAELIGAEILDDTCSIQASQQVTSEMGDACKTYLDTLNKQGIIIPTDIRITNPVSTFTKHAHSSPAPKLLKAAAHTSTHLSGHRLGPVFKVAQTALKAGKVQEYLHIMDYANLLQMNATLDQLLASANSGLWYDLPALSGASNVWMSSTQNFSKNVGVLTAPAILGNLLNQITIDANALDVALDQARPLIVQALHQRVVRAVSPNAKLGETILSQANHAAHFFAELDALLKSPFMKDIIGYWSLNKTQSHTLYDIVAALRSDYIHMISSESNAIETLQNLAILQDFHSDNVVSGKLALKRFVSSTSVSIRIVLNSTTTTNDKFRNSAKDFEAVLRVISANISAIEQRICDLDPELHKAEKVKRERAVRIIAEIIALAFSSSKLLTSFGVIGSVAAALDLAIQTGASAASVSASVIAVLDSFSTSDLVKVIQSLQATRHTLQHSVDRLKKIQPLFRAVVSSVTSLKGTVHGMQDVLAAVQSDVDLGRSVTFTHEDSESAQVAWGKVRDDTQGWLDVVNKQSVVPQ